jgi:GNAT superfamily N-acetyltransferase
MTSNPTYSIIAYPAAKLPDTYRNMIFSKWLRSLRYGNDYYKLIDQEVYFTTYHIYIENLLSRPNAVVRLAALTEDQDVALGFSVARDNVLDYVHVQRDYRRTGIGTSLVPKGIDTITHLTKIGAGLWSLKLPQAKFNPFI